MKPKRLPLLTIMSLLILSTVFLLTAQPVKAQTGITINSDGSVTPSDGRITTADSTTYTFTTDITDTIEIMRDNIILNGNGHTLQSPDPGSWTGIYFYGYPTGVTIENIRIADFEEGVSIGGSFIQVIGNTFTNCSYIAINGYQDDHCTISNNNIAEPANENHGIWLEDANYTVISNNVITGGRPTNSAYGTYAIELDYPFINDQINGNSMTGGVGGIWMSGDDTYPYQNSNNQIFNNTIVDFTEGLTVAGDDNVNNYFHNNQIVNSGEYGIEVGSFSENAASNNTFYSNTISGSGTSGIIVTGSGIVGAGEYNNFTNNNVTGSPVGIELYSSAWGNIINGNYIANNNVALQLELNASDNIIIGNKVRSNQVGIQIIGDVYPCINNNIYHNDFVSNTQQVKQGSSDMSLNVWDNGYPSGGNYWTDYTGVDQYKGAAQNVAGVDDIGDTPYTTGMVTGMLGSNKDNYPFMTIMYNQTGVGSDYTGAIVTVDSGSYSLTQLPVSYMWSPTASHAYAFQSPLTVTPNVKRYVWMNNTGLSSSQSMSSIVVPYHGNITGNYITQYNMTVDATPNGALGASFQVTYTQLGVLYTNQLEYATWSDWIDANTTVTVASPQQYVPSSSGTDGIRYRFDSFNQSISSVYMDYVKVITLLYVTQYQISFAVAPSGSGTTSPSGTNVWTDAGSLSVSATPALNYTFSQWSSSTGSITFTNSSSNMATATVNGPGTITANFVSGTIPEDLAIEVMMLLAAVAVIVSLRYFRKRPKIAKCSQVKL